MNAMGFACSRLEGSIPWLIGEKSLESHHLIASVWPCGLNAMPYYSEFDRMHQILRACIESAIGDNETT